MLSSFAGCETVSSGCIGGCSSSSCIGILQCGTLSCVPHILFVESHGDFRMIHQTIWGNIVRLLILKRLARISRTIRAQWFHADQDHKSVDELLPSLAGAGCIDNAAARRHGTLLRIRLAETVADVALERLDDWHRLIEDGLHPGGLQLC